MFLHPFLLEKSLQRFFKSIVIIWFRCPGHDSGVGRPGCIDCSPGVLSCGIWRMNREEKSWKSVIFNLVPDVVFLKKISFPLCNAPAIRIRPGFLLNIIWFLRLHNWFSKRISHYSLRFTIEIDHSFMFQNIKYGHSD